MMAWTTEDWTTITYGGTTYYFAPTHFIYLGAPDRSVNQVVQESESGEIKVQQLDTNNRNLYEFRLFHMPSANQTIAGVTSRGYAALVTLITSTLNFRQNAATLKLPGDGAITTHTVRYWGDSFVHPVVRIKGGRASGRLYYGDGSTTVLFREDI